MSYTSPFRDIFKYIFSKCINTEYITKFLALITEEV